MTNDISYYSDYYNDLFITHGGLFSKRSVDHFLNTFDTSVLSNRNLMFWKEIKSYSLRAIHTHDEVGERQPILLELFKKLKLGKNLNLLQSEGDILLRDFVVEVKQPTHLTLSSSIKSSGEPNDQQLIRAMKFRKKHWGILTNASEWQIFYISDFETNNLSNPFISFSLMDLFDDEKNGYKHIALFINLLKSQEFRSAMLNHSNDNKHRSTEGFSVTLNSILKNFEELRMSEADIDRSIELFFRLTFIFYCEDIGVLPRISRDYSKFDLRKSIAKNKKLELDDIQIALNAYSKQKWSKNKILSSGNESFWSDEWRTWISKNINTISRANAMSLWFDDSFNEYDMSEISSSDLCDAYQLCVKSDSDNVGTVYTSQGLSNYINSSILNNLSKPLQDGDLVFDPACGSGHLLKRIIFICEKIIPLKYRSLPKNEIIRIFCTKFLAGMDKNNTAILIAKINIWLSCVQRGKSLDPLNNFRQVNTLRHFKESFSNKSNQVSDFILGEGARYRIIVSNPPWSMVHSNHPEKWIANDEFWERHKDSISRQDNLAFNFAFLSNELLSKDGLALMIMPGVFFVGSTSKIRDHLADQIITYAPSVKNSAFESVSPTQNFGIITFSKKKREGDLRVAVGLDSSSLKYFTIPKETIFLPSVLKLKVPSLDSIFPTSTLLPLFSGYEDFLHFQFVLQKSTPTVLWKKGSKGNTINGEHLIDKRSATITKYLASSENRGSSHNPILLYPVTSSVFSNCSHKVIKLDLSDSNLAKAKLLIEYFNSEFFNRIIRILRTNKSVQSAILNIIGLPNSDLLSLEKQYDLLMKTDSVLNKVQKKFKRAS